MKDSRQLEDSEQFYDNEQLKIHPTTKLIEIHFKNSPRILRR